MIKEQQTCCKGCFLYRASGAGLGGNWIAARGLRYQRERERGPICLTKIKQDPVAGDENETHFNLEIRCERTGERGNSSWWGHCCLESPERDKLPPWAAALEVGTADMKGKGCLSSPIPSV